jgi:hypothetical protein
MSFTLLLTLLQLALGKSSTRLLLFLLCLHACDTCGRVYCSVSRLAREMNCHERNVKTLLKQLLQAGVIEKTGERGPKNTTVYYLKGVVESSPDDITRVVKSSPTVGVQSPLQSACKHHPITSRNQDHTHDGELSTELRHALVRLLGPEGEAIYHRQFGEPHHVGNSHHRPQD